MDNRQDACSTDNLSRQSVIFGLPKIDLAWRVASDGQQRQNQSQNSDRPSHNIRDIYRRFFPFFAEKLEITSRLTI